MIFLSRAGRAIKFVNVFLKSIILIISCFSGRENKATANLLSSRSMNVKALMGVLHAEIPVRGRRKETAASRGLWGTEHCSDCCDQVSPYLWTNPHTDCLYVSDTCIIKLSLFLYLLQTIIFEAKTIDGSLFQKKDGIMVLLRDVLNKLMGLYFNSNILAMFFPKVIGQHSVRFSAKSSVGDPSAG